MDLDISRPFRFVRRQTCRLVWKELIQTSIEKTKSLENVSEYHDAIAHDC